MAVKHLHEVSHVRFRQIRNALPGLDDRLGETLYALLEIPHRHGALNAFTGNQRTVSLVLEGQQKLRVPGCQQPARKQLLDLFRQLQDAERVRNRRPALADALRDILLGDAELILEQSIPLGLLDDVQVFPLDVLHHAHLCGLAVFRIDENDGDLL